MLEQMIQATAGLGDAQVSAILMDAEGNKRMGRSRGINRSPESELLSYSFQRELVPVSRFSGKYILMFLSALRRLSILNLRRKIPCPRKQKHRNYRSSLPGLLPILEKTHQTTRKSFKYCEGYKQFLNAGKTERECVKEAVHMLKKAGYKPFDRTASYEPGDKVYYVNRRKAIIATTFGKKPLSEVCISMELILTPQDWT